MRKKLVFPLALGLALFTVPSQTGCGSNDCAKPGESCMTKDCCPDSNGGVSKHETFTYTSTGVQTLASCTCS